jgi:hypothetical protein
MERRRVRIGDVIDDYCTRCRLIMNHGVAAMVGDDVRKVRCNTCMSEHVYKHGKVPARKRRETEKLFAEVLRGMGREPGDPTAAAEPEPATAPGSDGTRAASTGETAGDDGASGDADTRAAGGAAGSGGAEPAGGAEGPGGAAPDAEADRPVDPIRGARRKLYTIRHFSGGKAPTGGGSTGGTTGGTTGGSRGR